MRVGSRFFGYTVYSSYIYLPCLGIYVMKRTILVYGLSTSFAGHLSNRGRFVTGIARSFVVLRHADGFRL